MVPPRRVDESDAIDWQGPVLSASAARVQASIARSSSFVSTPDALRNTSNAPATVIFRFQLNGPLHRLIGGLPIRDRQLVATRYHELFDHLICLIGEQRQ